MPVTLISSIFPKLSLPKRESAPTNDDNNTGLISESKMRSNKYSPDSLHITIPLISLVILNTLKFVNLNCSLLLIIV